jgi:two-component system, chemotaxis family, CheB/CheR fusion protein
MNTGQADASVQARLATIVVGIGASAGGLAAFAAFFQGMPVGACAGMAFVLVQHLAPDHPSALAELVARFTPLTVRQAQDGMSVEADHVYVIPPGRDMAYLKGRLQLLAPGEPHGHRKPVDFFFTSLAQDLRERAIVIVLSGTGSDGARGVQAVKALGGMAMAQSSASAEFDGMPRSAVATGLVDHELAPQDMPARLAARVALRPGRPPAVAMLPARRDEALLGQVFVLLRARTGHDFSQYKHNGVMRRIDRRMVVHGIEGLSHYVAYLQQTPDEAQALLHDLMIGVTSFFRDAGAFHALHTQVIPGLLAGRQTGAPIRVWVPGCSTGEEAYSIAMLLQEQGVGPVQVFASDIDARALTAARAGLFQLRIAKEISAQRLERWFSAEPDVGGLRIAKAIRDLLVFSEHDVVRDPPFMRLDLVSCRNLLIYMGSELQQRLLTLFHAALNPGGYLFLGGSETVGECGHLFTAIDREARLYRRAETLPGPRRAPARRRQALQPAVSRSGALKSPNDALRSAHEAAQSANEELLSSNQELETSREELQSLNEELATVNAELQAKVVALSRANSDMNNLLAGTGIATVFVDPQLRILRFTPTAKDLIELTPGDVGRPVARLAAGLRGHERIASDTQAVLDTLAPMEVDVQTRQGRWTTMRTLPYRTLNNVVEGAVITFVDITEVVHTREALRAANELLRLAVVVRDAHDAITVQDLEGRTLAWNPGAVRMYGWSEAEALAMNVRDRIPPALREEALATLSRLSRAEVLLPYLTRRTSKSGAELAVSMVSTALVNAAGRVYAIATTERTPDAMLID